MKKELKLTQLNLVKTLSINSTSVLQMKNEKQLINNVLTITEKEKLDPN